MDLKASKILITGAGGYIGSVATSLFLAKGYKVVAVDNYIRGFEEPLQYLQQRYPKDQFRYYSLDISKEISSVLAKEQDIQAVVHYAAFCNVGESEQAPQLYFGNNLQITLALLEAMRQYEIKNILFSSTCSLYGEPKEDFITEKHPVDPTSHPYSESKYMCERMIKWYAGLFDFKYLFLRYFNVCGASDDGEIGDSKKPSYHLMQNAVRGALGLHKFKLNNTVVNTPDQTPIRDYVNVVDLNEAHILAIEYLLKKKKSDIFNLGTGTGNSVLEIITAVENILGVKLEKQIGERRTTDVSRAVASNAKITKVLGWQPKRSIEDSVQSLVKWYGKRPKGWKK